MSNKKKIALILVLIGAAFFILSPPVLPENISSEELLNLAGGKDTVIVFSSGGWGNTPLEKAKDYYSVVLGIQNTLSDMGHQSVVVTYNRTKDDLLGMVTAYKEFFNSFELSSKDLASDLNNFLEKDSSKKIILTGLSNGATFMTKTAEKVPDQFNQSIYVISAGTPFWYKAHQSERILQLDRTQDSLHKGDIHFLTTIAFNAPVKWFSSRINGQPLTFSQSLHFPGHDYYWDSSEVGPRIKEFLEANFQ